MTQGKRRFTYISFIGQKRYNHADFRSLQNTNERQIVLVLSHQWIKEIRQNIMKSRGKGNFTLKVCREIIEKIRERSDLYKITKSFPYSSGITGIFSSWNYSSTTTIKSLEKN